MESVLEKFEIQLAGVVRHVVFFDHVDQRLADIDRVDAIALDSDRALSSAFITNRVEMPTEPFPFRFFAQFLHVDLLRSSLLNHFFAVVEAQFGHEITLSVGSRRERTANMEAISSVCGATWARKSELRRIF